MSEATPKFSAEVPFEGLSPLFCFSAVSCKPAEGEDEVFREELAFSGDEDLEESILDTPVPSAATASVLSVDPSLVPILPIKAARDL